MTETKQDYDENDIDSMIRVMQRKVKYHEGAATLYKKGIEMLKNA